MKIRVYFNKHGNEDTAWSVDFGTQDTEKHFAKVVSFVGGQSIYTGERPNPDKPVAWLEFYGKLEVNGHTAMIRRIKYE
jgi:hypothetical protein